MGAPPSSVGGVHLRSADVLSVLMISGVPGAFGFATKNINNIVSIHCLSYNSHDNEITCNWIKHLLHGLTALMFCDGGLGLLGPALFSAITLNS